jgi:plastocyanin
MLNLRKETSPTTRRISYIFFPLTLWWILFPVNSGFSYEEFSNFTGGHLEGTISIKGSLVSPRRFNLVLYADPYYCGRISDGKGWRFSPITRPGPNRSLAGAIVYLEEVQRGKPIPSTPRVVQTKNCVFHPYISSTKAGEPLRFQNWDPVEHKLEIFLTSSTGGRRLFGQSLPPHPDNRKSDFLSEGTTGQHRPGPEVDYTVDEPGIILFRCSYHEYMEGWSLVLSHPYATMAGERGEFSITDIPPGTYNLVVWHPMGQTRTSIHILPKHTLNLDVDILSTSATFYPETTPEPDPYGIDLVGDAHIAPTVELQQWDAPSKSVR